MTFRSKSLFVGFVLFSEQTAIVFPDIIKNSQSAIGSIILSVRHSAESVIGPIRRRNIQPVYQLHQ
jgi:hypothetical protein